MPSVNLTNILLTIQKDLKDFRVEFNDFKDEMYWFRDEMYGFRDEMYGFKDEMYGFKDEMYVFKDEMYGFRDEMYGFRVEVNEKLSSHTRSLMNVEKTLGFYKDMYDMNKETLVNHEKRISTLEIS